MTDAAARSHQIRLAILVAFSAALGMHALSNSHFRADDYAHFKLAAELPLLELLGTPIDVHFAPLHRLLTAALYTFFPMRFDVAVLFLVACHIASFITLDRLLERLNPSPWNAAWVTLFAANVFVIVPLAWWTSGLHRFPFSLLSIVCVYGYLRFRDDGAARYLLLALASFALAMGFYSKAALIPPTLLALEICLVHRPAAASAAWRWGAVGASAAGVGLYTLSYAAHPSGFAPLDPNFATLPQTWLHSAAVLAHAPFTLVASPEEPFGIWAPVLWVVLIVYTVARAAYNAVVWTAFLGLIGLHIAMIGLSQRADSLGAMTAYVYRYYYDLGLPVALCLNLVVGNLARRAPRFTAPGWLRSDWLPVALVVVYALFAFRSADALMENRYGMNRLAHDYVTTLDHEIERLHGELGSDLVLLDGAVPRYVWVYDRTLRRHSGFLPLLGVDARYDVPADDLYTIDAGGTARRVRPQTLFAVGPSGAESATMRASAAVSSFEHGCLAARAEEVVALELPEPVSLNRGMVIVEYQTARPHTLRVSVRSAAGQILPLRGGHPLDLVPESSARLLNLIPRAAGESFEVGSIDLTLPAGSSGLCIRAVRLASY